MKAKLVARGIEEGCLTKYHEEFQYTVKYVQTVPSLSVQKEWNLQTIDIKKLTGMSIKKLPWEANCEKGHIYKLNICLYVLSDIPLD